MTARLGIDIGGTFTDAAAIGEDGRLQIGKRLTSVGAEDRAVIDAASESGVPIDDPDLILAHGTTLVINALLERTGAKVAIVTTSGFADVHEIGRGNRPEAFDPIFRRDPSLVPESRRFEVDERTSGTGTVLRTPSPSDLKRVADEIRASGTEAIAIAFLNSYLNPDNERMAAAYLEEEFPDLHVTISSDISRRAREYERTTTAAANAQVAPSIDHYLGRLQRGLGQGGFQGDFVVLDSNGGALTPELAVRYPVRVVESGPVAGVMAARELAAELELGNVVTFDMGGTTAKSSVIENGTFPSTDLYWIGGYSRGFPLQVPSVDIVEVGAGGGSIAWIDESGRLRVGPRSASAKPGPACYGLGGTEPTVTDANLYCGRLAAGLSGMPSLDRDAATHAIEGLAARLDMEPMRLALGIIELANLSMSSAVRRQTLERGRPPREFTLIASGGAGPMHACAVAAEVGIQDVIVPVHPGHFSAIGMLRANLRFERSESVHMPLDALDLDRLSAALMQLSAEVRELLLTAGVAAEDRVDLNWSASVRYRGQEHTLRISAPTGSDVDEGLAEALVMAFNDEYLRRYGHLDELSATEICELHMVGERPLPPPPAARRAHDEPTDAESTVTWFGLDEAPYHTAVVSRSALAPGASLAGPCIVCEEGATTVVPPEAEVEVLEDLSLLIHL